MESLYFFGEHLRWNLGWNNPNQAGTFVAMWIPWLWALQRWVLGSSKDGDRRPLLGPWQEVATTLALTAELILWFLLCKTYSRGALVAVGVAAGVFMFLEYRLDRRVHGLGLLVVRLMAIGTMLFATGFFTRIDPRFVSQDASAGNRLVLWKGGLQMIADSPLHGWGAGQSGSNFMHWFQPLGANEKYGGMVNSYLHVGVEYGLPVLAAITAVAGAIWIISWKCGWRSIGAIRAGSGPLQDSKGTIGTFKMKVCLMGAGGSWLVFLVANVFSTLWVFRDLWWLAAADCLLILVIGWALEARRPFTMLAHAIGMATVFAMLIATSLYAMGKSIRSDVRIAYYPGERVAVTAAKRYDLRALIFPESSVLGDDWGKEIRRLAATEKFRHFEISAPVADSADVTCRSPQLIIACGGRFSAGILALQKFPDAHLILVHPVGRPNLPQGFKGSVSVILPMLDTRNSGRAWKAVCKQNSWEISMSPGVGQDIRPLWPGAIHE